MHEYKIVAATCHYGQDLTAGHYYRTCWHHPVSRCCWLADDDAVARKITRQEFELQMEGSYIFWVVRIAEPA